MESIWSDRPNREATAANYRVLRTPAKGVVDGIVCSTEMIGTHLHFYRGRSCPCTKSQCEACEAGHVPRWKGYVLIMHPKTRHIAIFEFTERAYEEFLRRQNQYGSIRGCILQAKRTSTRPNGPVQVTFEEARFDESLIPAVPDLREIMERIWEIKQTEIPFPENRTTNGRGEQREDIPGQMRLIG